MDGDKQHVTIDIIKDWIDDIVMSFPPEKGTPRPVKFQRPANLKLIECGSKFCAFVKCFADDEWC